MTDIVARMKALPDLTNEKAWEVVTEGAKEIERLRQALEDVVNPLGHLRRYAEEQGRQLNGMAYGIANDLGYVQSIARKAINPE